MDNGDLPNNFLLEETPGILMRNPKFKTLINPVQKDKRHELIWIVEKKTKHKWNKAEWALAGILKKHIPDSKCICSHSIHDIYFIEHLPTSKIFGVGSECVTKINSKLQPTKKSCKVCLEPIIDGRTAIAKKECCSYKCLLEFTKIKFHFGKHKGKHITSEPEYCKWLLTEDWVYEDLKADIRKYLNLE